MTDALSDARPATAPVQVRAVLGQLSVLDRLLPVWIVLAMAVGLGLGSAIPGLPAALDSLKVDTVSIPIAIGLMWMMYPVLARVKYEQLTAGRIRHAWRFYGISLTFNWLIGPVLMFALAWLLLPDLPEYRTGIILVGLARCIAMVLMWNHLAGGDREDAAVLVALNSVFQVLTYPLYAFLFLAVVPRWLGLGGGQAVNIGFWDVAKTVLVFLGIPLAAGVITRAIGTRARGTAWYDEVAMPRLAPTSLVALLFTIIVMFSLKGDVILALPGDVLRIAAPLAVYFALSFGTAFWIGHRSGFPYTRTVTLAFTAAGNDFELAIAVAVAVFGIASKEALATVVGPLIEVPVLVALVYVALWLGRRLLWGAPQSAESGAAATGVHSSAPARSSAGS